MNTPLILTHRGLSASADRVTVRDPKGRGMRPSVETLNGGLALYGRAGLRIEYAVAKSDAIRFLEATGDENRIHRDEEIVPGAYTASKILALLEVVAPDLAVQDVKVKFTAPTFYGQRTLADLRFVPGADGQVEIVGQTSAHGEPVAETTVNALRIPYAARAVVVKERAINSTNLALVQDYFHSLGLDGTAYFHKAALPDWTFPIGFLASLPSGEMVRRFAGQGGILNALSLSFGGEVRPTLEIPTPLKVDFENAKARQASVFRRVATKIMAGLTTFGRGMALVATGRPGQSAPQ